MAPLTEPSPSRTPASIRGGAIMVRSCWVTCLVFLLVACDRREASVDLEEPILAELASGAAPVESRAPEAQLRDVRVFGADAPDSAGARVVLHFEGAPLFEQERLERTGLLPARVVLELKNAELQGSLRPLIEVGRGGVSRVRLAGPGPRVVVDLQEGAEGHVFYLTDPHRIVIDVVPGDRRRARRTSPVIVLDPGHGGPEPGAANDRFDLLEAKVALDIARLTRSRLEQIIPDAVVVLTREDDSALSLEARCALANSLEADVFVSIHLNAGASDVTTGGVTTFVLDVTNDRQALRLAARENGTRVASVTGIQRMLAHHHRASQSRESIELANAIQRATLARGRRVVTELSDRGVRSAMFYVLVGARMPAVLVEASFLTYAPEARALMTKRYRRELASGIASGIVSFLEAR